MLTRPVILLKLEYATLFTATLLIYSHLHLSWLLFGILFLAPDLCMLGYVINPRVGSAIYNLGHILPVPAILFAIAAQQRSEKLAAISLIWIAHIAFDRILGYGLKYPTHFKDTHLQHVI
jgi:hypothetical protein